jgi:hypothetical protein
LAISTAHFLTTFDSPVTITYCHSKSEQAINGFVQSCEFVQSIASIFFGYWISTLLAWVFHSIRINGVEDSGNAAEQSRSSTDPRDRYRK